MKFFPLVFLISLARAYSIWDDNPTENLFSASDSNVFDVTYVSSSLTDTSDFLPEYFSDESDFIETDASTVDWDPFLVNSLCQDSAEAEDHLAISYPEVDPSIENEDLFAQYSVQDPEDDLFVDLSAQYSAEDHLFEMKDLLATYYPEDDLFVETGDSAADHFFKTRDLHANYYLEGNAESISMELLDSWSTIANSDDYVLSSNSRGGQNPPHMPRYEIDPNTPAHVGYNNAYAKDGTPIKKGHCPKGKNRTCCDWTAAVPLNNCWYPPGPKPYKICAPAMNIFCCSSILLRGAMKEGGTGQNCERVPWFRDVRRRPVSSEEYPYEDPSEESSEEPSQTPSRIDLQEIFPILQPLPELPDPNPGYCLITQS